MQYFLSSLCDLCVLCGENILNHGNMADKERDDGTDHDGFREAVRGARPLKQDRVAPYRRRRKPTPEHKQREEQEVMQNLLADDYEPSEGETGGERLFVR